MSQEEMLATNRASLRALAREQHQARLLRRQNNRQPLNGTPRCAVCAVCAMCAVCAVCCVLTPAGGGQARERRGRSR
jgi:hypothetical protein